MTDRHPKLGPGLIFLVSLVAVSLLGSEAGNLRLPWERSPGPPLVERTRLPAHPQGIVMQHGQVVTTGPEGLALHRLREGRLVRVALLREGSGHSLASAGPGRVLVAEGRSLKLINVNGPPYVESRLDDGPPAGFGKVAGGDQGLFAAAGPAGVYRVIPRGRKLEVSKVFGGARDARGVAVAGEDLAVADGPGGLLIMLPDGQSGRLRLPGFARDVAVAGNYAAVALGSGGLAVADLTVRKAPQLMLLFEWAAPTMEVEFAEPRLVVGSWRHLGVLDFTIPGEPRFQAWLPVDEPVTSVALAGDLVLAGTWESLRQMEFHPSVRAPQIQAPSRVVAPPHGPAVIPVANLGSRPLRIGMKAGFRMEPDRLALAPGRVEELRAHGSGELVLRTDTPGLPDLEVEVARPRVDLEAVRSLSLETLEGVAWRLEGRVVLSFFDPAVPLSRQEITDFGPVSRLYQGEAVEFVPVAVSSDRRATAMAARLLDLPQPVVLDPHRRLYDLLEPASGGAERPFPRQYVVGPEGVLFGSSTWDPTGLQRALRHR